MIGEGLLEVFLVELIDGCVRRRAGQAEFIEPAAHGWGVVPVEAGELDAVVPPACNLLHQPPQIFLGIFSNRVQLQSDGQCVAHEGSYLCAMGMRRPNPKARPVTFRPGGVCLRLYSLRSMSLTNRMTSSGS